MAAAAAKEPLLALNIGDLEATLASENHLQVFRHFLRGLDGKAKADPQVKG